MSRTRLALVGCAAGLMLAAGAFPALAVHRGSLKPPVEAIDPADTEVEQDADAKALASDPAADAYYNQPAQSAIPREIVEYNGPEEPGTIVISTTEKRLYFVMPDHEALRYGVGVGRPGFEWSGVKTVTAKREWPDWTPPPEMIKRRPELPRHMAGGIENPLGARAMYLGGTMYRIHGSNEPDTIGQAVSSGCIRMTNDDVADLYDRVTIGTKAIIAR